MKGRQGTRTVLRNIIISYIVIFVVIVGIWLGAMNEIFGIARDQNAEIYGNVLETLSYSVDKDLLVAERAALNVALSASLSSLIYQWKGDQKDILMIKDIKENLADVMQNQSVIENGFLYMKNKDYIIAYNTTGTTLTYYRTYVEEMGISHEDWVAWMDKISRNGYYLMKTNEKEYVYYAYLTPINSTKKEAVILLQFYEESLGADMDGTDDLENVGFEMISANGQTILTYEGDVENCQILSVRSDDTGWTYRGYIQNGEFYHNLSKVTRWTVLGALLITIICGLALYISFRTHYVPLKTIVKNLESAMDAPSRNANEYNYISSSLDKLIQKQKEDQGELEHQGEKLKAVYLQYLFSGRCRPENIRESDLELFGLRFVENRFCMAAFQRNAAENDETELFRKDGIYWEGKRIFRGIRARNQDCEVIYFLNPGMAELSELKNQIRVFAENHGTYGSPGKYGSSCRISLSALHSGGKEIYPAYEEILELMRVQASRGSESEPQPLFYDEYSREKKQNKLQKDILDYIAEHYSDPDLNVESVCQALNKSVSGVNKALREAGTEGILYYINERRVEEAKRIFQETKGSLSVKEVMARVGYENQNTFIRVFKKYENMTPGEYCKSCKNA